MQIYKREIERLDSVKSSVRHCFPHFGRNKRQEITRLLYEISKREEIKPSEIIETAGIKDYNTLKAKLLEKRYPNSYSKDSSFRPYLPKMELGEEERCNLKEKGFYPKNIFAEEKAEGTYLAERFRKRFPKARFGKIGSLNSYINSRKKSKIRDYNNRRDTVFIVNETKDYFKVCPCTKLALGCGYHIFNLGFGCIYECSYCYLQDYTNSPGIILPANIDSFFAKFESYKKIGMRIGTGEFSDSLALDGITGYSVPIVDFFRKQRNVTFEFKTKSANVENILKSRSSPNIAVSWSLNPQDIIDENEFFTPSLNDRLSAALKCSEAGYKVGFHFDPIIYFKGWEDKYESVIDCLFSKIKPKDIAWISLGTFRFSPHLKQAIERRFPENRILDEELIFGFDGKLRYTYMVRYKIYKSMIQRLMEYSEYLNIYLCMEQRKMWRDLRLEMPGWKITA